MSNYCEVGPDGRGGLLLQIDRETAQDIVNALQGEGVDWISDVRFNILTALQRFPAPPRQVLKAVD